MHLQPRIPFEVFMKQRPFDFTHRPFAAFLLLRLRAMFFFLSKPGYLPSCLKFGSIFGEVPSSL